MSNKNKSHRPLRPTAANIENIKNQFVQHASNKVVVQGADYQKTEQTVSDEQLHQEAEQQKFYPFPVSGLICEWVSNPTRPGIFVICVNLEEDKTKEPRPGFFATCRQPEVAQMLCDGVNFLFKCQKQMEEMGAAGGSPEEATVPFQPVVVDSNSTPRVDSTQ
jgi:hypothetical protein